MTKIPDLCAPEKLQMHNWYYRLISCMKI